MLVTKKLSFKKSSTQSQSFEKEKIMWWGHLQHHCILLSGIFWREIVQYPLTLEKVYECKFQHYHWSPQINGSIVLILAHLSLSKDQWDKKNIPSDVSNSNSYSSRSTHFQINQTSGVYSRHSNGIKFLSFYSKWLILVIVIGIHFFFVLSINCGSY